METIYKGRRPGTGDVEVVVAVGENETPLHPRGLYSSGFEWGYGGSGPAELAAAIIEDAIERGIVPKDAQGYIADFKWYVIATLPHQSWCLYGASIRSWWEEVKRSFSFPDEAQNTQEV